VSASSLPLMFACALTLYSVVGWVLYVRKFTIFSKIVLSGWLLCSEGCFIWFLIAYRPLRQFVKICVGSFTTSFYNYFKGMVNGH